MNLAALLLLAGCETPSAKPEGSRPDADATRPDDTATTSPPGEETCNGVDDDGDGAVDEGFEDVDANGVADCLQSCVAAVVAVGASVEPNPECVAWEGAPTADPWNVEKLWELEIVNPENGQTVGLGTFPMVIDGAGGRRIVAIGDDLVLDHDQGVVVDVTPEGTLALLEGPVGWSSPAPGSGAADVDGAGEIALFAELDDSSVARLDEARSIVWSSPGPMDTSMAPLVLTDLEGDGVAELINQSYVFNALTGERLFQLFDPPHAYNSQLSTADLDLDGVQEILFGGAVSDATGVVRWQVSVTGLDMIYPMVVQADLDPEGEVVWVGDGMRIYDTDGTPLTDKISLLGYLLSPPCAGDLDGDGRMEIVTPTSTVVAAWELDGTRMWALDEPAEFAGGCSVADLNGDGAAEVLYARDSFLILEGATGAILYEDPSPPPMYTITHPTPVDLDGDGSTEIIVVGGDPTAPGTPSIAVYGHAGNRISQDPTPAWTPAGTTWMTHDASGGERNDDGTIPTTPVAAWSRYGVFRGRLASPDSHPLGVDLQVELTDVCVASCDVGPVLVSIQVSNAGTLPAPAGTVLAIRAIDATAERTVATLVLPEVPAGTSLDGLVLELTPADLGQLGLSATVDDDGTGVTAVYECDDTNNTDEWWVSPCG